MRHVLLASIAAATSMLPLALSGQPSGAQAPRVEPAAARHPELIALSFHADWCAQCKAMGSVFADLTNRFDGEPVHFVTIDQTNQSRSMQSEYLLAELGLGKLWLDNGGKTGYILLIEPKDGKVARKLPATMSFDEMAQAVTAALD